MNTNTYTKWTVVPDQLRIKLCGFGKLRDEIIQERNRLSQSQRLYRWGQVFDEAILIADEIISD